MLARRILFIAIAAAAAVGTTAWLAAILGAGGWTATRAAFLACFAATAPWLGLCAAHGWTGFAVLLRATRSPPVPIAAADLPTIAIALTVRDEDPAAFLPPLLRLLDGLDTAGAGDRIRAFVLSDTQHPGRAAAEAAALAPLAGLVRYRRRASNTGFKAGNIMEFLDHHAQGCVLMLTLDADSQMSAQAVLRMARMLAADPTLGLVQHLTVGLPTPAAFPRLFQFGMRAGMRVWATAQSWWQGDEGPYWGHNAMLRIAPFRAHCRLPDLRGGRPILSHDQIEAVRLRAAGWGVRLLAEECGSAEHHPPAMPEFLLRELRWTAGNMQYLQLLGMPGLRPMGRWQLMQAVLLFAGAPFLVLMMGLAAAGAWLDPAARLSPAATAGFMAAWWGLLHGPKLLGYAQVLASSTRRVAYGGGTRFMAGAALEIAFTTLLNPVGSVARTLRLIRLVAGRRSAWLPQNRIARRIGWGEAVRLFWPQTLLGLLVSAGLASAGPRALLWGLPFTLGLKLAVPFCVATADPRLGRWLVRQGLAAMPEELVVPCWMEAAVRPAPQPAGPADAGLQPAPRPPVPHPGVPAATIP